MPAHDGRQHPLPAMVRPAPGVVEGGDQLAAVRRQAGEPEPACGSLAEQVARLAATVTELVERPAPVPLSVSVDEAARLLGLGRSSLFKLMESGELRSVKVGSRRLGPRRALEEFLAGHDVSAISSEPRPWRHGRPTVEARSSNARTAAGTTGSRWVLSRATPTSSPSDARLRRRASTKPSSGRNAEIRESVAVCRQELLRKTGAEPRRGQRSWSGEPEVGFEPMN